MDWSTPKRPVQHAEELLVRAIISGQFPINSTLSGERILAEQMGITRPTLREAIRSLERDGWLDVQHGKSTRVRDFWREGGLNVLSSIVKYSDQLTPDFVTNLLRVRLDLAPAYTRQAVDVNPNKVIELLEDYDNLPDTPNAFAKFDWALHHGLTLASGNPVYTLILNGFAGFYEQMAQIYFMLDDSRETSCQFYADLLQIAQNEDLDGAELVTRVVMQKSVELWQTANVTIDLNHK